MRQVGGRWRWAHGWLVGCEGDGGGHMVGWLAELTGASTSYWKPWAPISLTLSLYIYIWFNICINRKTKGDRIQHYITVHNLCEPATRKNQMLRKLQQSHLTVIYT
jgi:hypothetical protein